MFATRRAVGRARLWSALVGTIAVLGGCGQRGALYMPDRNARVVTRPAAASAPAVPSSAPASAPN